MFSTSSSPTGYKKTTSLIQLICFLSNLSTLLETWIICPKYQSAQHFYTSGLVFKYKSLNGWKGPIICGRYIIHKMIYTSALANLIQFSLLFSSQSLCSSLSRSFVCVFSLCIAALLVLEMSASLQVFMGKRSSGGWGSSIWQTNLSSTRLTQLTCCINALPIVINLHDV